MKHNDGSKTWPIIEGFIPHSIKEWLWTETQTADTSIKESFV